MHRPATRPVLAFAWTLSVALAAGAGAAELPWRFIPQASPITTEPEGAPPPPFQLDDGSWEGTFGIGGSTARSFLWFNQFSLPPSFLDLQEIQVLFPPGPNMAVGNAVDLVVFHDPDGDATNGATWLATYPEVIQHVDGTQFSVYTVDPLHLPSGGSLLVGVVPRFIVAGVTTQTSPAALDTTASMGASWLAVWTADPPSPPELPPDLLIDTIDAFVPGNWMIRAAASDTPAIVVPTSSAPGLTLLTILLAMAGLVGLRGR